MNLEISDVLEITIVANFWAAGLREPLEFWLNELGVIGRTQLAPFDQPFQYLLTRRSDKGRPSVLSLILLQLERWSRDRNYVDPAELARNSDDLLKALREAVAQDPEQRYQVLFCPITPNHPSADILHAVQSNFADACAASLPEVDVVTSAELDRLYNVDDYGAYFDSYAEKMSENPYSPLCYATLSTMVVRKLYLRHARPRKVIVVDCDNTLWSGVVGEVGPLGVEIGPSRRLLHRFLIEQVERGRLLCLCSKNDEDDVMAVFNGHPEMLLKTTHLAAWKVNWQPKAENLHSLSTNLGLNLDSFIFIDDDPFECSLVQALCPEALTIHLPKDESQIESSLLKVWELDQRPPTADDRLRTLYYRQNAERSRVLEQTSSLQDFLDNLELEVTFEPIRTDTVHRASQLTERTNQFNLNGTRRSAGELSAALRDRCQMCEFVAARDRFGDYGTVGVIIGRRSFESLHVETLLLSCRALGRGIEKRMLERLVTLAQGVGATELKFDYRSTSKNGLLRTFLSGLGISGENPKILLGKLHQIFPPHATASRVAGA